jgi:fibronectin-binding autotransporter adhesin
VPDWIAKAAAGGAGLGGALFVGYFATVTISNVTVLSSSAIGGTGGEAVGGIGAGGGGGLGGAGGTGTGPDAGGGGGFGNLAVGGTTSAGGPGIVTGAGPGGESQFPGGADGGGGGAGGLTGGGGGVNGDAAYTDGGNGGLGGGGGGGSLADAYGGSGGFGGGGGGGLFGGAGGFGAGGGGTLAIGPGGFGGLFGGNGGNAGGGGGAGLGGAIYVEGSIVISGALNINGSSVTPGSGAGGGTAGQAFGAAIYLGGFGSLAFDIPAGTVSEISDSIVDETGAGLIDGGYWWVDKTGDGTLILSGNNLLSGGTTILGGTLQITNQNNIGTGMVGIRDATLSITANGNFTQILGISNLATLDIAPGATVNWSGDIFDDDDLGAEGTLQVTGGGVLALTGVNTYSIGTIIRGGSTVRVSSDGALGGPAGTLTLGDATTTGALSIAAGSNFTSARDVYLGAGGGILDAQAGASATLNGVISGSGGLAKTGPGTVLLAGVNTYAGATSVQGGLLRAGASSIFSPTAGMDVAGGATLDLDGFNQSVGSLSGAGNVALGTAGLTVGGSGASSVFSGVLDGPGSLVKTGAGVLTLTGPNSYTGGTLVSQGVLLGTTTSLQGNIVNNAMVVFDQAAEGTYSGLMSGSGALVKNGAGPLVLAGANTYTGGTIVTAGTLAGTTTSLQGAIANSGTVAFDQGTDGTFAGTISGVGALVKAGSGVLTLNGANAHAGGTAVTAGAVLTSAAGVFGTGGLQIAGGAAVDLAGNDQTLTTLSGDGSLSLGSAALTVGAGDGSSAFDGVISGSGSLVKDGAGTFVLTGANTYSGGTTVAVGSLAGTSTSLQGNIVNNGLLVFDQSFDGTYAGSTSGTGILQKAGAGTLTVTGAHTHTGGTLVTGGTLIGTAANLRGTILNDASVIFGGDADGVFQGTLAGGGTFGKQGTGTLFVTGNHSHSGTFDITSGTVDLDGILGSRVFVSPGATMRALGAVLGSVNVGGSLVVPSPGLPAAAAARATAATAGSDALDTPPLVTVGGDLDLVPGSTLFMPVGSGPNPTILVGGSAALNGATIAVDPIEPVTARATSFLALAAQNGLTLANTGAVSTDPLLVPSLRQDQNLLFVTMLNMGIPLSTEVTNPNAASVGEAIDRFKLGSTGDHLVVIRELTGLGDAALNDALRQVSGEAHASLLQFGIRDSEAATDIIRRQISSRRREVRLGGRLGPSWWAQFGGERGRLSNADGERVGTLDIANGIGGLDYRPSERWLFGFGGGAAGGNMSLSDLSSSADILAPRAFGYAGFRPKGFGLRAGGSFARQRSDTRRRIIFQALLPPELGGGPIGDGINREATAEETSLVSDQWSEYDDEVDIKSYTLEWLVGLRRASFTRRGFIEAGADALSLLLPEQTLTLRQTNVQMHLWRHEGDVRPFFEVLYRREMTDGKTTTELEFPGVPDSRFLVDGLPAPKNIVNARGGATLFTMLGAWTFEYQYRRATGQTTHSGDVRVRF